MPSTHAALPKKAIEGWQHGIGKVRLEIFILFFPSISLSIFSFLSTPLFSLLLCSSEKSVYSYDEKWVEFDQLEPHTTVNMKTSNIRWYFHSGWDIWVSSKRRRCWNITFTIFKYLCFHRIISVKNAELSLKGEHFFFLSVLSYFHSSLHIYLDTDRIEIYNLINKNTQTHLYTYTHM